MKLKTFFLLTFLAFAVLTVAALKIKPKKANLPTHEPNINENIQSIVNEHNQDLDLESEAYSVGFKKGKNAFLIQNNDPNAAPVEFKEEYTVAFEMPEEQKKLYEEALMRGYVDGYHRSAEMTFCPGKE